MHSAQGKHARNPQTRRVFLCRLVVFLLSDCIRRGVDGDAREVEKKSRERSDPRRLGSKLVVWVKSRGGRHPRNLSSLGACLQQKISCAGLSLVNLEGGHTSSLRMNEDSQVELDATDTLFSSSRVDRVFRRLVESVFSFDSCWFFYGIASIRASPS